MQLQPLAQTPFKEIKMYNLLNKRIGYLKVWEYPVYLLTGFILGVMLLG